MTISGALKHCTCCGGLCRGCGKVWIFLNAQRKDAAWLCAACCRMAIDRGAKPSEAVRG